MKIHRAIGIDLGTTNSASAMMSLTADSIVVYTDESGRQTYPSILAFDPIQEEFVTGWDAWNRRTLKPAPIASIKRKMGDSTTVSIGDQTLTPPEVSARILKDLSTHSLPYFAGRAEVEELQTTRCVITVPAYFDANQIDATRRAGEAAGLSVLSLVQEPTAACMYYAWRHGIGDGTFLVYDLGGGTFDVSVLRCLHGEFQVLGIDGDNVLGGDDFDRRLATHFWERLSAEYNLGELDIDDADSSWRFELLKRLAREAKETLSSEDEAYVARQGLFEDIDGREVTLDFEVTRSDFEAMIQDLVSQTIDSAHRALEKSREAADVGLSDIENVLLVGGSTRIPLVRKAVQDAFCGPHSKAESWTSDSPDTCVALGAAIQAANLGGIEFELDNEHATRVRLSSTPYTHEAEIRVTGRVTSAPAATESVALLTEDSNVAAVTRLVPGEKGARFAFDPVTLEDRGLYRFQLELCDAEGEPLASVPLSIRRGHPDDFKPTGSALSSPTVLAKSIFLETVRDGRSHRSTLIADGTSLPTTERFRFKTADQSGAVVLKLFQNRLPIRTIHLTIPTDTPIGTPVDLDLSVDETMAVVARGEVAGQKFWAQVDPPAAADFEAIEDIEALLEKVEVVERMVWGNESRYFKERTEPLVQGIQETLRTDKERMRSLAARLEDVLEEYRVEHTALTPGWARAETLLNAIKRVAYRDDERKLGVTADAWRERITTLEERARAAYDEEVQAEWARAFDQIQATWESLAQEEYRFHSGADPAAHLAKLRSVLDQRISEMRSRIDEFDLSSNPETRELQRAELDAIASALTTTVDKRLKTVDLDAHPSTVKPEIDRLFESLNHLQKRLDRVPTLGLVTR